jgi:hypothetical protein
MSMPMPLRNVKENGATTLFQNLKTSFHGLLNQFVSSEQPIRFLEWCRPEFRMS